MRDNSTLTDALHYYYKADYKTAITELEEKLSIAVNDSDKANIYYWLGECYYNLKEYQKSIDMYKQANTLHPDYILYKYCLGCVYFYTKQTATAEQMWNTIPIEILQTTDDYFGYILSLYYQNKFEEIIKYSDKILSDNGYVYNFLGVIYSTCGKIISSISCYNKAIELEPEYVEAYNNRGLIYKDLKNYNAAIDDFTKITQINPKYTDAYNNRGYIYGILKEYDNAINDFTRAIKLQSENANLYCNRGGAYHDKGDLDSAEQDCIKALELEPNNQGAKKLQELVQFKRKSQAVVTEGREEISKISQELQEYTPQSLVRKTIIGSRIRTTIAYILYIAEIIIYGLILYGSYEFLTIDFEKSPMIKNIKFITDFMHAYSFSERILFLILLKLTFFIPFIFLILAIRHTAKHLQMRGEFDSDTAMQWSFYNEIASELKESCKKNDTTEEDKKYYREFLDKHITLRSKTNFELLHDVLQKKSKEKSISTKQISDGLDILQKAKDILTPPDDKKTP